MTSSNGKPTLNLGINIPEFTLMRITTPLMLNTLQLSPLQFDYSNSQYASFPQEILQKIGVKLNEDGGLISSFVSDLACMSCTACKAMSRDTLMQINSRDLQTSEKGPIKNHTVPTEQQQPVDESKRQAFQKIWKTEKKKHIKPSSVKFEDAFKQNHKLSEEEWAVKVKTLFN